MAEQRTMMIDLADLQEGQSVLRVRAADFNALCRHVFKRTPREWGAFFRFGWRRMPWGVALFYVDPLLPNPGDLDRNSVITVFRDPYTHRAFRHAATSNGLGLGVVHSHPPGCSTRPSELDDDMDAYYAREFVAHTENAPYCSLILQRGVNGGLTFSGRVFDRGMWIPLTELVITGKRTERLTSEANPVAGKGLGEFDAPTESTTARLQAVFGARAEERLSRATVGVVGCSGTGSPIIEALARAGVGELVLVDPDRLSASNLERVHGLYMRHLSDSPLPLKVDVARELVHAIRPETRVTSLAGNVLHENVLDELVRCDLVFGCTDSQHGRAALSDFAHHYLLPVIDLGLRMDGNDGSVTEQLVDLCVYGPDLPCAFCSGNIDPTGMAYELMTEGERKYRQQVAVEAAARGGNPDQYWRERPRQIHTVGYLTTLAGVLAAGYGIGMLTGAFSPPHNHFQFDIGMHKFGFVAVPAEAATCACLSRRGQGDIARAYRNVALPSHWAKRAVLRSRS